MLTLFPLDATNRAPVTPAFLRALVAVVHNGKNAGQWSLWRNR